MRRTKIEIFLDILETLMLNGPLGVTHIMRKANVRYNDLKEYLTFAISGFIVNKDGYVYSITPMGIQLYKALKKFWKEVKKE